MITVGYASGEVLVLLDGDGQHPPEEIPKLLAEIEKYDIVKLPTS